jgi:hypothetical protein
LLMLSWEMVYQLVKLEIISVWCPLDTNYHLSFEYATHSPCYFNSGKLPSRLFSLHMSFCSMFLHG